MKAEVNDLKNMNQWRISGKPNINYWKILTIELTFGKTYKNEEKREDTVWMKMKTQIEVSREHNIKTILCINS